MTNVSDFGCRFSELISAKTNRVFGACALEYTAKVSYATDIAFIQ
jgi:hypothetical protein